MGNFIVLLIGLLGRGPQLRAARKSDAYLWAMAILAISAVAGPNLFAAVEMSTLLDILGAALFWMAFVAGAQLLAIRAGGFLRSLLLPQGWDWLLLIPTLPARAAAMMWIGRNALAVFIVAVALHGALRALPV
jgi:hypothetical protein